MIFKIDIEILQPSQLYISKTKLDRVNQWLDERIEDYDPIPIKNLNGKWIIVDGHTRLYALYQRNIKEIRVMEEYEKLDWNAYRICVDWCIEDKIKTIKHLSGKLISHNEYMSLWIDRCHKMHQELENNLKEI